MSRFVTPVLIALWLWLKKQETNPNDLTENETCLGEVTMDVIKELRAEWEDSKNTIDELKAKLNESRKDAGEAWTFVKAISMETKVEIAEAAGESKVCLETRRSFADRLKMFILDNKRRDKKEVREEINHIFAAFEAHEEEKYVASEHQTSWLLAVSIVSTILLGSVLIKTRTSHATESQALMTELLIERARCISLEEAEYERVRGEMKASEKLQRYVPPSTEPLLSPEGYGEENETSESRPKRRSTWKDVVMTLSDVGEIDIDELDSSLYDDEVYASVNAAIKMLTETDSNKASRSNIKRTSTWKDVVTRLSIAGEIDIDELDNSLHDEEVYASVNEAA